MKKLLAAACVLTLLLTLTSCSKNSASGASAEQAAFALLSQGKLAYSVERPQTVAPGDLLFVRVNPGTISGPQGPATNAEDYFIAETPLTAEQAQGCAPIAAYAAGQEAGKPLSLDLAKIQELMTKLAAAVPGAALPTAGQWDYAFLCGKIPEESQPMVWEWARKDSGEGCTWRGRMWHFMELTAAEDPERDPAAVQPNLGFRPAFLPAK